jgi:hypothetical protein
MLRKNSSFGDRRIKGLMYIGGQYLGGILGALAIKFLNLPEVD